MKREELRDLGLSDEQVSKVMGMHSAELNDIRANLQDATSERDQLKKQRSIPVSMGNTYR